MALPPMGEVFVRLFVETDGAGVAEAGRDDVA
jgi:hypothetical protein